ncbi:MAG: hypothetical protein AMXMBFR34_36090 [Myxococcaceae bacterium]
MIVKGLVQGVCYRATAQDEARALGLAGWVRNLPNGDVEARAQGDGPKVDAFITWCRRGPDEARVEAVRVDDVPVEDGLADFRVAR